MNFTFSEDQLLFQESVRDFLLNEVTPDRIRAGWDTQSGRDQKLWQQLTELGLVAMTVPEEFGGSGYGLEELAVVTEEMGRAVAPGPFVPTVVVSALVSACGDSETKQKLLPGLVDGSVCAGMALEALVTAAGNTLTGRSDAVLAGGMANLMVLPVGDDVALVELGAGGSGPGSGGRSPTRRHPPRPGRRHRPRVRR